MKWIAAIGEWFVNLFTSKARKAIVGLKEGETPRDLVRDFGLIKDLPPGPFKTRECVGDMSIYDARGSRLAITGDLLRFVAESRLGWDQAVRRAYAAEKALDGYMENQVFLNELYRLCVDLERLMVPEDGFEEYLENPEFLHTIDKINKLVKAIKKRG
jgi:hypothetical protein